MAFWEDLSKKVKDAAVITAEKAKDVAAVASEKAKDTAELAKINLAIAGEQRELEKNYRAIGEWFVTEYDGELPEAVKALADAVAASKAKIAELEASKPSKAEKPAETAEAVEEAADEVTEAVEEAVDEAAEIVEEAAETAEEADVNPGLKKCPICGAETDSRFCPQCGAPVIE